MAGDASNSGYCSPKFVAYIIRKADNGVRRTSSKSGVPPDPATSKRADSGVVGPAFGFRHLPIDVGLLALGRRLGARRLFVHTPESSALTLLDRALAFVRAPLPIVR